MPGRGGGKRPAISQGKQGYSDNEAIAGTNAEERKAYLAGESVDPKGSKQIRPRLRSGAI